MTMRLSAIIARCRELGEEDPETNASSVIMICVADGVRFIDEDTEEKMDDLESENASLEDERDGLASELDLVEMEAKKERRRAEAAEKELSDAQNEIADLKSKLKIATSSGRTS
jgi:hypothetical protein